MSLSFISVARIVDLKYPFMLFQVLAIAVSLLGFIAVIYNFISRRLIIQNKIIFVFLLVWTVIILMRGLRFEYDFVYMLFLSSYFFMPFLLPFVAGAYKYSDVRKIIKVITFLNVLYLYFAIQEFSYVVERSGVSISFVENLNHYLAFPNFLLIFLYFKISKLERIISLVVYLVGLFMSLFMARRGLVWTFSCAGALSILLVFFNQNNLKLKYFSKIYVIILLLVVIAFIFNYKSIFLDFIVDRLYEDSRGFVVSAFYNDMSAVDMIFGKGIGGAYFVGADSMDGVVNGYRGIIESGYLNIILYGGYVYIILLAVIYFGAIRNGLFRSNNIFAKAFGLYIFLHVLELYPAGVFFFNVQFLLIWISVSMCFDKNFLGMSDQKIFGGK
jgi:hypothetical protein